MTWVVLRIAYVAFYLSERSTLRSAAQFASLACVLGLFIAAAVG